MTQEIQGKKLFYSLLFQIILLICGSLIWFFGMVIAGIWLWPFVYTKPTFLPDFLYSLWLETHGPGLIPVLISVLTLLVYLFIIIKSLLKIYAIRNLAINLLSETELSNADISKSPTKSYIYMVLIILIPTLATVFIIWQSF